MGSKFPRPRFGHVTSNIAESSNSWILEERKGSWFECAVGIVRKLNSRAHTKRGEYTSVSQLHTPWLSARMDAAIKAGKRREVHPVSGEIFEVMRKDGTNAVVNITLKECSCKVWQEYQYPCVHGCAAILFVGQDPLTYVSEYYSMSRLQSVFVEHVVPVDVSTLTNDESKPPHVPVKKGRPKKIRLRNRSECAPEDSTIHCSVCSRSGHNKRTCRRRV